MLRLVVLLLASLTVLATATIAYFLWWDESHCVICRTRLDEFGGCLSPDCERTRLVEQVATG